MTRRVGAGGSGGDRADGILCRGGGRTPYLDLSWSVWFLVENGVYATVGEWGPAS